MSERPRTNWQRKRVDIASLHPLERAFVRPIVEQRRAELRAGVQPEMPDVVEIDGELLVTDGTHRVLAAKEEGHAQIDVLLVSPGPAEIYCTLALARSREMKNQGFNRLIETESEAEREALAEQFSAQVRPECQARPSRSAEPADHRSPAELRRTPNVPPP